MPKDFPDSWWVRSDSDERWSLDGPTSPQDMISELCAIYGEAPADVRFGSNEATRC